MPYECGYPGLEAARGQVRFNGETLAAGGYEPADRGELILGLRMSGCSKARYRNLLDAQLALRAIQRASARRGRNAPTGAYLCPTCRCWHLTSKSWTKHPRG